MENGQIPTPRLIRTRPSAKSFRNRHRTRWRIRGWRQKGRSLQCLRRRFLAYTRNLQPRSSSRRTRISRKTQTPKCSREDENCSLSLQIGFFGVWVGKTWEWGREVVGLVCDCDFDVDAEGNNNTIPVVCYFIGQYDDEYAFAFMGKGPWLRCSFPGSWCLLWWSRKDRVRFPFILWWL